jgi:hypothetical protein
MIKQVLLIAFVIMSLFSFGQTNSTIEPPYIEVTGTAEKEIVPDEIYIGITISEKFVNKEKVTIEEQETKLKSAVTSLGINLENLSLSDANADYIKIQWQKKDVMTKKEYTVKVSDATTVGKVFQKLDEIEITDAWISKVSHSKLDSLRKEVRIMAIKAAKAKADYLLEALGEQTGKPLSITEIANMPERTLETINIRGSRADEQFYYVDGINYKGGNNEVIQFEKIKLQASINVKFAIK